jgi:hypothetical protein
MYSTTQIGSRLWVMSDTEPVRNSSSNGLAIAIGCGFITAVWFFIQLRVWQEEGHDHMQTAFNVLVTIFLWALLSYSIYRNRKDARRAESLLAEIVTTKDDAKTQIEVLEKRLAKAIASKSNVSPLWAGHGSEEDWHASIAEQNRLVELGRTIDGLLIPLQVDTLRLSKYLLQFLVDMGNRPEVSAEMFMYDSRGNRKDPSIVLQEQMTATNRVLLPWIARVRSNFKADLLPKLEDISLRYGKLGIGVDLVPHSEEYLLNNRWVFDVSLELVKLAHGIDTMKVVSVLDKP